MQYYKSFNAEAMELSKTLPEEQSELYKRYFVPLPLERFVDKMNGDGGDDEDKSLKELSELIGRNYNIKFDLVAGSTRNLAPSSNKYVKTIRMNHITEEHLKNKLYSNKDDKLVSFIHAHTGEIVAIDIPDGEKVALNVLFVNTDTPLCTQVLIKVGREARLDLFEWCASKTTGESLSGVLHEVRLDAYAKGEINILRNEDKNTSVVGFAKGKVNDNAELKINYIYNGGSNVRSKNEINASGYAAKSTANEIVIGSSEQKFDINTIIANLESDTVSDLESRAVLLDKSLCILKGFANVGEKAKGSKSFVNERGLLLDKMAQMSSIPGMSINNSDVKATHSSATAPVDIDSLFYLTSRGMGEISAKKLLVSGFFASSIAKIENPIVKAVVASLIHEKINNKRFGNVPALDTIGVWFEKSSDDIFAGHYKYR